MRFTRPISESQLKENLQNQKDESYKASVQSALADEAAERIFCDTAIINSYTADLNAEKSARQSADTALENSLSAEITNRQNAVAAVEDSLYNEGQTRNAQIKTIGDNLNAEVNARTNADATLSAAINSIRTQLNDDASIKTALANEIAERTNQTATINSGIEGLRTLHNLDKAELQDSITAEKTARQSDVSVLQSSISTVESNYKAADVTLKSYVDGEVANLKSSDTAIWTALSSEVTLRNSQTSSLASALNAEVNLQANHFTSASNSISAISSALNAEIANRTNADTAIKNSLESAVTNFNNSYKVFTSSTTNQAGTAGIVPAPPILEDSDTVYYLTNKGWGEPIELDVKIGVIPSQAGSLTFNGNTQTPQWADYDPLALEITGTTSASDAGTYTAYFTPRDGYKWTNGTRDRMSATWKIDAYIVTIPTASTTSFEYTGNSITLNVTNFDSTGSSQTGTTSATNRGDYTAKYELKSTKNYKFSDGTTAAKTISWFILVKKIQQPTISNTTFDYDGNSHAPTINGFDATWMTKSGTESSINAGTFTITFALADKTNTQWHTGQTYDISKDWIINRKKLTAAQSTGFEQNGTITYGGLSDKWTVSIKNYDSSIHKLSGDVTKTYAGTYTAYVSPADNLCWSDGTFAAKPVTWEIQKHVVTKPTSKGTLTYNGSTQTGVNEPDNYAHFYCNVTGKTAKDVGNYTCTYSITDLNKGSVLWDDGTTNDVVLNWSIVQGAGITKPTLSETSFEWTGGNITPTINNFNSSTMTKSGSDTAVALGTYSITVALKDKNNTSWADGSTADVVLSYTITKRTLAKPTLATSSFDYDNGAVKAPYVNNFDSTYMQKSSSSVNASSQAGNYSIIISLKDKNNCQWEGGGSADVTLNWVINRKLLSAVTFSQSGSLTYNGSSQNVTIANYDSTTMTMSSTTSATNAGTYTATVTPKSNYCWSTGTYESKSVSWSINKVKYNKPTLTNATYTYDGNKHSPTINNYYSDYMNMTGTTETATAGTYTVTFSLKDTVNRAWSDESTANVTATWTINKATPTLTLSATSVTLDNDTQTSTVTYIYTGDGAVNAVSSNNDVADAVAYANSSSINTMAKGFGTATITVSAAEGINYKAVSAGQTVSVTSQYCPPFGSCSWETIHAILNFNSGALATTYWNVGDAKDLGNNFGGITTNSNFFALIIGIDSVYYRNGNTLYKQNAKGYVDIAFVKKIERLYGPISYISLANEANTNSYILDASAAKDACVNFYNNLPDNVKACIIKPAEGARYITYIAGEEHSLQVSGMRFIYVPATGDIEAGGDSFDSTWPFEVFLNGNASLFWSGLDFWTLHFAGVNKSYYIYKDSGTFKKAADEITNSHGFLPWCRLGRNGGQ